MAAKKGKDTLKELGQFLKEQDSADGQAGDAGEFLESKPRTLVQVNRLRDELNASENPDEEFLADAVMQIAAAKETTPQAILYGLIEAVLSKIEEPDPGDLLLLSSVQYLAHNQRLDAKLQDLLKE